MTKKHKVLAYGFILVLSSASLALLGAPQKTLAATNVITVNSSADTVVQDDGECTLREAINNANANADLTNGGGGGDCAAGVVTSPTDWDVIEFAITGAADFTNGGQNGYVITTVAGLPGINDRVTIDGFSQPGALANTQASPLPLNTRILIEVNDTVQSGGGTTFTLSGASSSIIQGLALGGGSASIAVVGSTDVHVSGNYIGFHADGSGFGYTANGVDVYNGSDRFQLGGILPAERNVTGNIGNSGYAVTVSDNGGQSANDSVIEGNYFGVGPDGTTAATTAAANVNIQGVDNSLIGGTDPGARNVMVNAQGMGIAVQSGSSSDTHDTTILGNYIGILPDGVTPAGNSVGVYLGSNNMGVTQNFDTIIGSADAGNTISASTAANMVVSSSPGTIIQGNNVGTNANGETDPAINNSIGIATNGLITSMLIGGTEPGQGNTIAGNKGGGILIVDTTFQMIPVTLTSRGVSILGNSIDNTAEHQFFTGGGLAIELAESFDSDGDFSPDSFQNIGPTPNDAGDGDTGPNNYINFPVLDKLTQDGNQATISFSLDAAGSSSGQYRIEFFANDATDASGHGEAQTYLGYSTVSNGTNQASITLPTGYSLQGKYVSATATAVDGASFSGFGDTSELSQNIQLSTPVINLASSGQPTVIAIIGASVVVTTGLIARRNRRKAYAAV